MVYLTYAPEHLCASLTYKMGKKRKKFIWKKRDDDHHVPSVTHQFFFIYDTLVKYRFLRDRYLTAFFSVSIMFILSILKDTIHIQPYNFYKSKYDALTDEINRIYANKVGNLI